MSRRIKMNQWGNWKGYEGNRGVYDFGTDVQAAQSWQVGGPLPKFDASIYKNKIGAKLSPQIEVTGDGSQSMNGPDYPITVRVVRGRNAQLIDLSVGEALLIAARIRAVCK